MSGRGKDGKVKGKAKSRSCRAGLQFTVGRSVSSYAPLLLLQALFGIVLLIHGMHCQQTLCLPHLWQCLNGLDLSKFAVLF